MRTKRDYLRIAISHVNVSSEQRPVDQQVGMSALAVLGDSLENLWVEAIVTVRMN